MSDNRYEKVGTFVSAFLNLIKGAKEMKNCITKSEVIEKQVVYSKDLKDRYELTVKVQGKKGKSILMLCMNPATENVLVSDTTTNYLMNNLFVMGYTTITICNLFSKCYPAN